jgi:hypothetical protein
MRWLEVAMPRGAITRLLAKHGLGPQPPSRTANQPIVGAAHTAVESVSGARKGCGAGSGPGHRASANLRSRDHEALPPSRLLRQISTKSCPPRRSVAQL